MEKHCIGRLNAVFVDLISPNYNEYPAVIAQSLQALSERKRCGPLSEARSHDRIDSHLRASDRPEGRGSPDYALGGKGRGSFDHGAPPARGSPDYRSLSGFRKVGQPAASHLERSRSPLTGRQNRELARDAKDGKAGRGGKAGGSSRSEAVKRALQTQLGDAERAGRQRRRADEREGGVWTRYVFDASAPLVEEQAELAGENDARPLFGASTLAQRRGAASEQRW